MKAIPDVGFAVVEPEAVDEGEAVGAEVGEEVGGEVGAEVVEEVEGGGEGKWGGTGGEVGDCVGEDEVPDVEIAVDEPLLEEIVAKVVVAEDEVAIVFQINAHNLLFFE